MKSITRLSIIFIVVIAGFSACNKDQGSAPGKLRCEYSERPLSVETLQPRFSWQMADTGRGAAQTAYQILVASKPSLLKEKKADVWNSQIVTSPQSVFVEFEGQELKSGQVYYWKVRIWDQHGKASVWSETAVFEMGKLSPSDWKAAWIGFDPVELTGDSMLANPLPRSVMLRKEFEVKGKISRARAYVSGLGNYVLFLNGKKTGNEFLTPGWTDYHKRVQYQVYDVTQSLVQGRNAAGMMLGNAWWSGGLGWAGNQFYSQGPLRSILQLEIEYSNGKTDTIITDSSWKGQLSPIIENSLYHGETYDARLEIPMWSEAGLEDSGWFPVKKIETGITLSEAVGPGITITDTIVPVAVNEVKPGVYVFDMGTNMVGFARLKVNGNNGDTVVMRFAELTHEDGTVAQENLRSAKATDRFILKGAGEETWQPAFTYHGFQYVQVEGLKFKPTPENLIGLRFYSAPEVTGHFETSNELINKIYGNIVNGQRGNLMSVPTDCPQRDERLGWMGDAQIFAPTAAYNMDMAGFFKKWMRDITDSQHESGYVYDVNPAIVVDGPSKAGWGDAVVIVPWTMYQFYGDKRILSDNYEGMKAWVEYMKRKSQDHVYRWSQKAGDWEGYGDWIAVVKSPTEPISQAYYYQSTKLLANIAQVLGKQEDGAYYASLADSIASAFNKKFFDEKKLNYPEGTQTANLIPLAFGLTPEAHRASIAGNVYKDVSERGMHPSTGFLGTSLLLPMLSEWGYHQAAWETAIQEEYPSWGYMVRKGASSIWELWNSDTERPEGMNSRNHFALGGIGEWYFGYLAGIRALQPGFREIIVAPMPAEGLDHVKAHHITPYGRLEVEWTNRDGEFNLKLIVPANSSALVKLPVSADNFIVKESENELIAGKEIPGLKVMGKTGKTFDVITEAGSYHFVVDNQ